jgi:hypothetical protein
MGRNTLLSDRPLTRTEIQRRWRAKQRLAKNRFANTTTICGNNADLMVAVCRLYLEPRYTIADLTYRNGVFWRKVGADIRQRVVGSDLETVERGLVCDLRSTPYADNSFDVCVLDLPYAHTGRVPNHLTASRYDASTTLAHSHDEIRALYRDSLKEASRIARHQIWVKCKDEIESGRQCWSHIEIFKDATALGLYARDMFILIPPSGGVTERWRTQHHARKAHSYLWVFERSR